MSDGQQPTKLSQIQTLLENIRVGGNLTTGDMVQVITHFRPTYRRSKIRPQSLPSGTQKFVGRSRELEAIRQAFQARQGVVISAIAGMGGVGKTELAIQYALEHQQDYPGGILWLNALRQDLAAQIVSFVDKYILEMPEEIRGVAQPEFQLQYCLQYWNGRGQVLLILDDVTKESTFQDLLQNLPPQFHVLITTRIQGLDPHFDEFPLDVLPIENALSLLRTLVNPERQDWAERDVSQPSRVDRELDQAKQLCESVGRLPLAIELLGCYLAKQPFLTIVALLGTLTLEGEALAREQEQVMTATRGVSAAFEVSWQGLSAVAQQAGRILGLFGSERFDWELVSQIGGRVGVAEDGLQAARDELYRQHWMQLVESQVFRLHPLVQQFLAGKMQIAEQQASLRQAFVDELVEMAQAVPIQPTLEILPSLKSLIPHWTVLIKEFCDLLSDEDLIWPFLVIGRFYRGQGLYGLAESSYEQCAEIAKSRLGEAHPDYAMSLHNLAGLYASQGRYGEAEPLYRQSLEIERKCIGEAHPSYAMSLHNLGSWIK